MLATGDGRVREVEYLSMLSFCVLHQGALKWHIFYRAAQNKLKCKHVSKVQF